MNFVAFDRFDDPRMDTASFAVDGPDLHAQSTIDAYMIDELFSGIDDVVAGTRQKATSMAGELEFERQEDGEVRLSLSGGPYASGKRVWSCSFAVAPHAVAAFVKAIEEEFSSVGRTKVIDDRT